MTQPQAEIEELVKSYPVLANEKMERRLNTLQRMATFYQTHAKDSRDGGHTFTIYFKTLLYAETIIRMHFKLTNRLAKLSQDSDKILNVK